MKLPLFGLFCPISKSSLYTVHHCTRKNRFKLWTSKKYIMQLSIMEFQDLTPCFFWHLVPFYCVVQISLEFIHVNQWTIIHWLISEFVGVWLFNHSLISFKFNIFSNVKYSLLLDIYRILEDLSWVRCFYLK